MGEPSLGQPGWVWLLLGVLIGIPAGVNVHRRSSRIRDPRTGANMVPTSSRWGLAVFIGIPLALILITWAIIEIFASAN